MTRLAACGRCGARETDEVLEYQHGDVWRIECVPCNHRGESQRTFIVSVGREATRETWNRAMAAWGRIKERRAAQVAP